MKNPFALFLITLLLCVTGISGTACGFIDEWTVDDDTEAPTISDIQVTNITTTKATISWATNEATTSNINYGLDTTYGSSAPPQDNTTENKVYTMGHSVVISGLNPETTYYFEINIQDSAGNKAVKGGQSFTTSPAPIGDLAFH